MVFVPLGLSLVVDIAAGLVLIHRSNSASLRTTWRDCCAATSARPVCFGSGRAPLPERTSFPRCRLCHTGHGDRFLRALDGRDAVATPGHRQFAGRVLATLPFFQQSADFLRDKLTRLIASRLQHRRNAKGDCGRAPPPGARMAGAEGAQLRRRVREQRPGLVLGNRLARHPVLCLGAAGRGLPVRARGVARPPVHRPAVSRQHSETVEERKTLGFHLSARFPFSDVVVRPASDQDVHWSLSGNPIFDDNGRFFGFRGIGTDLTEQRRSEREISRLARFDSLTSLPNRAMMRQTLEEALRNATHRQKGCGIHDRPRPIQERQRHARPSDRRCLASPGRRAAEIGDGQPRPGRAARRRRIPGRAPGTVDIG